jgi:hypothetical protein
LSYSAALPAKPDDVSISVCPSGDAPATMTPATVPPALGRLSITICCPQLSSILGAIMRARMSLALPGVNGTTMRIGPVGYDGAAPCVKTGMTATPP